VDNEGGRRRKKEGEGGRRKKEGGKRRGVPGDLSGFSNSLESKFSRS
jgi:hypothetical protein